MAAQDTDTCYKTLKETLNVNPATVRELYISLTDDVRLEQDQSITDDMLEAACQQAFGTGEKEEESNATAALKLYLLSQKKDSQNLGLVQLMSVYAKILPCERVSYDEWTELQEDRFVFVDPSAVLDPFVLKLTEAGFTRAYASPAPQQNTFQVRSVAAMQYPFKEIPRAEWLQYKKMGKEVLAEPTVAHTPFILTTAETGNPTRLYARPLAECDVEDILPKGADKDVLLELFGSQKKLQ
jgi:hypothetical protein